MPRGRKKKFRFNFNIKPETLRSIFSLLLILLSLISLLSFFLPEYSVNAKIQQILRGLFGFPSFLFPFVLGLLGIFFIESLKIKFKEFRYILGLFFVLISLSSLFHIFMSGKSAYEAAVAGNGGGFIGYKISSMLRDTVSVYAGFPILLLSLVMSVIFTLDVSLESAVKKVSGSFSGFKLLGVFGNKKGSDDSDIEVVSSYSSRDSFDTLNGLEEDVFDEPKIEVIPTMSEPQSKKALNPSESLEKLSLANNNPLGADRMWEHPPLDILVDPVDEEGDSGDTKTRAKIIRDKLKSFGIDVEVADIQRGPSVTQYSLKANSDVRIAKIANLQNDLALALASPNGTVRIEAPIPGKSLVGIEVPNDVRGTVSFKSLISSGPMKASKSKLSIVLGKDVAGQVATYDISKMPHLLVAGTTGSGKSIFLHNLIFSLLFRASPQEVRLIMIDPKRVEFTHYQDIPHLLVPVVTDMDKAPSVFKWAVTEMDRRYKLFEQAKVMNIDGYNEKSGFQSMPYIVIIVDELAEIMIQDPAGVEKSIVRLAQLARATGIHLILALQRPTTNIITGLIKANIPARVAFNVMSNVDSRVIIDQPGAEKLLGKGDMLFIPPDRPKPVRLQGAFISLVEIKNLVGFLKAQGVSPEYREEILKMGSNSSFGGSNGGGSDVDELFNDSVEIVSAAGRASASLLQTRLSIGYARAARILSQLEEKGIVGPAEGSKPRHVLTSSDSSFSGFSEEPIDEVESLN